jgi:hypothetical protein
MSDEKVKEEMKGAFIESLKRNNRQIRDDRATAIGDVLKIDGDMYGNWSPQSNTIKIIKRGK